MVKIMLIEDDLSMITLLCTLLQMEGFSVAKSKDDSLDKTVAAIKKEQPELILLDVHLHQFSGFELLKQLRSDEILNDIRVLMMSGLDMKEESLKGGADDFILKPYMPDELIGTIHKILSAP